MRDDALIARGQRPAAHPSVCHDQAVESIARPSDGHGFLKPQRRRRIVDHPALITHHVRDARITMKFESSSLEKNLKLQQARWRCVEASAEPSERGGARVV